MAKRHICPSCGCVFDDSTPVNYSPSINALLSERSSSTRAMIKKLLNLMNKVNKPSNRDIFDLLDQTQDVSDSIFKYVLNIYYAQGHYVDKPLAYLRAMILSQDKDKSKLKEIEKKIHGTAPPVKEY